MKPLYVTVSVNIINTIYVINTFIRKVGEEKTIYCLECISKLLQKVELLFKFENIKKKKKTRF